MSTTTTTREINLHAAANQWANRPADERFGSLEELRDATLAHRRASKKADVKTGSLRVESTGRGNGLQLVGTNGGRCDLTHWSFGQLSQRAGAPAEYLRSLPAELAAQNINHGLARLDSDHDSRLLFGRNETGLTLRALTSDGYTRIWNHEVAAALIPLQSQGWRVPPARPALPNQPGTRKATAADVLRVGAGGGAKINVGDPIAPAGLYASDHDMFAFMINEDRRIDDGSEGGLCRGFFAMNSEVGAASWKWRTFLFRGICGNHIVWSASNVQEIRIVHRGDADERYREVLATELRKYADSSIAADVARIAAAKSCVIGDTRDEVIEALYTRKILPRVKLEAAYNFAVDEAEIHAAGSPRTAWGFAQGLTRLSQEFPYADARAEIDRAAGKVLALAL